MQLDLYYFSLQIKARRVSHLTLTYTYSYEGAANMS